MHNKSELDIKIGETLIKTVIKDGNKLIPLTDFMKAIYGKSFRKEIDSIKPEISEYIIKVGSKRYITLMGLSPILVKYGDKKLQGQIISQTLRLSLPKKDPVEVIYEGLIGISNITNVAQQVFDEVHKCDLKQSDLLHSLENNDLTEKEMANIAKEIKFLRKKRRDLKNKQKMLNLQTSELKNLGIKSSSDAGRAVTNMAKLRAELETSKEHGIYFNRDGSNEAEMRAKIQELSA